jgi:hypothetical protein
VFAPPSPSFLRRFQSREVGREGVREKGREGGKDVVWLIRFPWGEIQVSLILGAELFADREGGKMKTLVAKIMEGKEGGKEGGREAGREGGLRALARRRILRHGTLSGGRRENLARAPLHRQE